MEVALPLDECSGTPVTVSVPSSARPWCRYAAVQATPRIRAVVNTLLAITPKQAVSARSGPMV